MYNFKQVQISLEVNGHGTSNDEEACHAFANHFRETYDFERSSTNSSLEMIWETETLNHIIIISFMSQFCLRNMATVMAASI